MNELRTVRLLVGCYLGLSALTLVAAALLRDHPGLVTPGVWIRGTIVVAAAALTMSFAVRAGRGSRRSYQRLRVVSAAMLVAIAVIVALPGAFPMWFKVEQGGCGLLLLGVVVLVNSARLRSAFPRGDR